MKKIMLLFFVATNTCCFIATISDLFKWAEVYQKEENYEKAIVCYQTIVLSYPDQTSAWFKLGSCSLNIGKFDQALDAFEKIISHNKNSFSARYNHAYTLKCAGKLSESIEEMRDILKDDPEYDAVHLSLGFSLLQSGNFIEGWKQHERYLKSAGKYAKELRFFLQNSIENITILLVPEGGFGDTLQFIRYVQRLKEMGAKKIIVALPPALIPLLSQCYFIDEIISIKTTAPYHDAYATLMSLPAVFYDTEETIPNKFPYIFPDEERVSFWKDKLAADKNFKIGICWQPSIANDVSRMPIARRGVPLESFAPLFTLPNISWYSLQQYDGIEQIETFSHKDKLFVFNQAFDKAHGAFMDSAAIIQQLDLVISADTATAHLAGALGKEVWILLHVVTDWRWIHGRTDSPWYPTMTIFHQKKPFCWQEVVKQIVNKLNEKINKKP